MCSGPAQKPLLLCAGRISLRPFITMVTVGSALRRWIITSIPRAVAQFFDAAI
jgi:hypothetical protein